MSSSNFVSIFQDWMNIWASRSVPKQLMIVVGLKFGVSGIVDGKDIFDAELVFVVTMTVLQIFVDPVESFLEMEKIKCGFGKKFP